jgi:hypothetical protein
MGRDHFGNLDMGPRYEYNITIYFRESYGNVNWIKPVSE